MRNRWLALGFLAVAAHAETVSALWSRGYAMLPEPQQVELNSGDFRFGPAWSIDRSEGISAGDVAVESLAEELRSRYALQPPGTGGTAVRLIMQAGSVTPGNALDKDKQAIAEEAYRLDIGDTGVVITANAPAGLFYGVETLVQLLHPRNGELYLPKGRITDWPDLHMRHIYWDDAHHLEKLPELKRAIRQAAFFKINGFALKLEGHFQYRSASALVEPYALSPAEYQELTDYALRYHVQLVPFLDGPAHIAFILKHPEYAKYRSFPDSNYELCATNPEAVKFLSAMFQDLLDANRGGKYIYLSTDEPYYIGMADNAGCREKAAAQKLGSVGKLLAQFVTEVAEPMHKQGRTVMFWGEYPMVTSDIESLPSYMVNGEVYGPDFDPVFHKHGIRQMIYTSTQGEERFFPDYFTLPNARRLHPGRPASGRLQDGYEKIALDPSREQTDIIGTVVAGWADAGLHPETFWLGYSTITAAGWKPSARSAQESSAAFYKLFYGDGATNMNRVYQLMSEQAQFWTDSWEQGVSPRIGLFGNSEGIFNPRRPEKDPTLTLPPAPGADLTGSHAAEWRSENARRLQLAADALTDNDELLGLLEENMRSAQLNRYNLEVYLSIAQLYRQNLEMLLGMGHMCSALESAQKAAADNKPKDALEQLDSVLEAAQNIRRSRNLALRDAIVTWQKSWLPRGEAANGRQFLHQLDDVKDHVPDRTVDMSYLVYRELQLPFGDWVNGILRARNQYAAAHQLPQTSISFDWQDKEIVH
ncbi:MAG TPA: beta-N-acetylhexosaminidase [Bryobacteraceae bacterium]|nr:beta-N-acetylhexosaminidase [Bryobacteraceae bacterium]